MQKLQDKEDEMINQEISEIFYEMADILEMEKVDWKPVAYRNAARAIEAAEDLKEIYNKKGIDGLKNIPGVGESIAKKIIEYIKTGKIKEFNRLKKTIPEGLDKLIKISGLGPKKAMRLYGELKIKNVKDLEVAIKKHKLKNLFGFGEKSEENIAKGIERFKEGEKRYLLGEIYPIAESIINEIKDLKYVKKVEVAGSLKRMQETIGDIDILVISGRGREVMDKFCSLKEIKEILAKGDTKSMVILKNGIHADLRILDEKSYGAALQYFTGDKLHNIKLREIAIKQGYKLSEYGLFKNNKYVVGRTEKEIYKKLGLKFIEPELRTNSGELESSRLNKLPNLVELNDIKGDLHVHTNYSDGMNSLFEMINKAKSIGYNYIAITDHSKSQRIANGLNEERLEKQLKEIEELNKKFKNFKILSGSEVDILKNGEMDFDDSTLKKLDIVVAAVHSNFNLSEKEQTERICRAIENKYVKIIGHLTGRLIFKRDPLNLNIDKIFECCKENKKILEVNSMPDRMDIKDVYIRKAVENGIKICINTDSHDLNQFNLMKYGVAQARRGWAEKKDVLNCSKL